MKKILLTLALVAMSASAFAQTTLNGFLNFHNRVLQDASINGGASRNEPITLNAAAMAASGATTAFATPAFSIGLFYRNAQGVYVQAPGTGTVTPTGVGTFRPDGSGTMVQQVNTEITGIAAGSPATFQIRAWLTSQGSYDTATIRGSSGDLTVAALGGNPPGGGAPVTTPNLSGLGFTGFQIVPEPSTYALGIAGLGALALMRRRKQA